MSGPRVEITRTETTTGTLKMPASLLQDLDAIRAKYDIPTGAVYELEIPGGGDWSGMRLPLEEIEVVITWETTRDVE